MITLLNAEAPEMDTQVDHIDVWFDRDQFKVWYVTEYNAAGDPLGESRDFAHKTDAKNYAYDRRLEVAQAQGNACAVNIGTRR